MKKLILITAVLLLQIPKVAPAFDDLKCAIDYDYFEKTGENRKTIKLSKDGTKYKLYLKEGDKETTSYIYSDQNMVYTVINIKGTKSGSKHELETMFVGMSWGIYFLNFPKASDFTSTAARTGTETVAGKECILYELNFSPGVTKYSFWNDIMMKKTVFDGQQTVVTIQATSVNEAPVFGPGEFDYPTDIQYY